MKPHRPSSASRLGLEQAGKKCSPHSVGSREALRVMSLEFSFSPGILFPKFCLEEMLEHPGIRWEGELTTKVRAAPPKDTWGVVTDFIKSTFGLNEKTARFSPETPQNTHFSPETPQNAPCTQHC